MKSFLDPYVIVYLVICSLISGSCLYMFKRPELDNDVMERCAILCGALGVDRVSPDSCDCNTPPLFRQ